MEFKYAGSATNQKTILGHPSGLFVLFFTEMWERFSYYGMRAILVLFLTAAIFDEGGWGWERSDALVLYAWYTGLVYVTPVVGGFIADKFTGFRKAVVLGAIIMTLGHVSMALEVISEDFFYVGLGLLIIGNGLFKPNIGSIVGQLYKNQEKEKDAGYTIFYMGVNAGAFLGYVLCGYIGETIGWHYGFGLAGIFMLIGMLQFYFAQNIFGEIGLKTKNSLVKNADKISGTLLKTNTISESMITRDRLIAIGIFSFFTIFFWWAFEQAGGSMTIFAADYTDRTLVGDGAMLFKVTNTLLVTIPLLIITYVVYLLFKQTFLKFTVSNFFLGASFIGIWYLVIWMLARDFSSEVTEVKASWFGGLNSFFIIAFAPLFSKIWKGKYNPTGPIKFAMGLILLGLGFAILSYGSLGIPLGAKTASVSIVFLIFAYLFHTLGELCISPVGLSYVSKLAPVKLVGVMFGIWYISNFIANFAAGITGSYIDPIVENYGMTTFFLVFSAIPILVGFIMIGLNKTLLRLMHGIK